MLVLDFNKYAREFSKDFIIMKNNYKDSDKDFSLTSVSWKKYRNWRCNRKVYILKVF